ncbi:MAG TPA: hypothetical protein VFC29_02175, partial [Candidatus Limnocylindrales bacterium]|nr:hypothetical protein [Candidatus Limnocylindrales bacterium]
LNAVAVVAVADRGGDRVQGLIPTAWYPDHIALSPDGDYLAVATMLGVGSGWRGKKNEHQRYVHADRGTLHVISIPDPAQLAGFTSLGVCRNERFSPILTARYWGCLMGRSQYTVVEILSPTDS